MTGARSYTVVLRVKDEEGKWKRYPAAYGKNGRIRPGYAQVGDEQLEFGMPVYEIRHYVDRAVKYIPVLDAHDSSRRGTASDAEAKRRVLEEQSRVKNAAADAGLVIQEEEPQRPNIRSLMKTYIEDCELRQAYEAADQSRRVLGEFANAIGHVYLDEITRKDILLFHAALRKDGSSDRTIFNKHQRLRSFLKFAQAGKELMKHMKELVPKYDLKLPTVYTSEQIKNLLKGATKRERVIILLALKLGLRDQEISHAEFADVDFSASVYRVRSKPQYGFRVKDSEERDIPIPADMLKELKAWKQENKEKNCRLIVPTDLCQPDTKLLRHIKALAKHLNLNCGQCEGCKGKLKQCQQWTLHKFRRSYATRLLQSGAVDLRTVQQFMGHSHLPSTLRYLRPAHAEAAHAAINNIRW